MKTYCNRMNSGYLTVYLALTMAVLLSLCLALIEGTRRNAIRMETECVMEIGMNSILAEYHRELFSRYNIFAIDSSYGTINPGCENTKQHLFEYVERNFSTKDIFLSGLLYKDFLAIEADTIDVTGVSILTDENGAVFRRRAVQAVKDDCNLTLLEEVLQWMHVVESNGWNDIDIAGQKQSIDEQIEAYNGKDVQISSTEWATVQIQNPTEELEKIRRKGILKQVIKDEASLSSMRLNSEGLIMDRMKREQFNRGNLPVPQLSDWNQLTERFFFQEYLLKYMGRYGSEKKEGVLSYQSEYLLAGKDADIDNLKTTVNRICALREAANAMYLFSDQQKCMEAELAATLITGLLQVPELMTLLKVAIILGWAYAESIYDVKILMNGGRVPLLKDAESWHYGIQNALQAAGEADTAERKEGLSYKDYLRLLLMFVDMDTLTGRAMNMVEGDIRLTPGNSAFRLDACYDRVECRLRIRSRYGYQYEITRLKGYEVDKDTNY